MMWRAVRALILPLIALGGCCPLPRADLRLGEYFIHDPKAQHGLSGAKITIDEEFLTIDYFGRPGESYRVTYAIVGRWDPDREEVVE